MMSEMVTETKVEDAALNYFSASATLLTSELIDSLDQSLDLDNVIRRQHGAVRYDF